MPSAMLWLLASVSPNTPRLVCTFLPSEVQLIEVACTSWLCSVVGIKAVLLPPPKRDLPIFASSPATKAVVAAPAAILSGNGILLIALITALTPSTPASVAAIPWRVMLWVTKLTVAAICVAISLALIISLAIWYAFSSAANVL